MINIVILNTGCTNIFSVISAIKRIGYTPIVSTNLDKLKKADKLILPGIGTTVSAMNYLKKYELVNFLKNCNKQLLGICLGMQLLGTNSQENIDISTLGVININTKYIGNNNLPIPHMGWNKVIKCTDSYLFKNIKKESYFYFAHSYAMPLCPCTIAQTTYGESFSAAIENKNFFGVQFHPEISSKTGHKLLKNFLEM